jgi:hypothetical protein
LRHQLKRFAEGLDDLDPALGVHALNLSRLQSFDQAPNCVSWDFM